MSGDLAYDLRLTDSPDQLARRVIGQGLDEYNTEVTGINDRRDLAVLVKDSATEDVLGGLIGRTSLGLLFIDLVYLPAALRRNGIGSRALRMAEEEARNRGCRNAVLYTISFQAPEFYARHGWQEFGRIACEPAGTSRVFMTKRFIASAV
jgi:GNAT superfamily N-acetyltransferase